MKQPLSTGEFRWVDESEFESLRQRLLDIPADNPVAYVLEVDLIYPAELHDKHND